MTDKRDGTYSVRFFEGTIAKRVDGQFGKEDAPFTGAEASEIGYGSCLQAPDSKSAGAGVLRWYFSVCVGMFAAT